MIVSASTDKNGPDNLVCPVLPEAGCAASSSDRIRLAHAVLGRRKHGDLERVREVPRNNLHLGEEWLEVVYAVGLGIAYAGLIRPDILALDGDQDDNEVAVAQIVGELGQHGIVAVVEDSGQPGRVHVWARITDPDLKKTISDLADRLGLQPREWMRPPLAPHRLGLLTRLRTPMTVDMAEHVLKVRPERPLSQHAQELLCQGSLGQYGESALMSITNSAFQNGWTLEQTLAAVTGSALEPMLQRVAGKGKSTLQALLELWFKTIDYTHNHPAIGDRYDAAQQIADARTAMLTIRFPGKAGASQRAVLRALYDRAVRQNSVVVEASQRELVEEAGLATRGAIVNALDALARQGYLVSVKVSASVNERSTYRLLLPRVESSPLPTSGGGSWGEEELCSGLFLTHDTFARGGGLGRSAAWMYEALGSTPRRKDELARMAVLSEGQAKLALRALVKRHLAVKLEDSWVRGPADVDAVAVRRGSAGSGADLKAKHKAERFAYRGSEKKDDGGMRFVVLDTEGGPPSTCVATRRDGGSCQAKAMKGTTVCSAHREAGISPCPQDLAWADDIEAGVAFAYEN